MSIRDRATEHRLLIILAILFLTSQLAAAEPMNCLISNNGAGSSHNPVVQTGDRTVVYFDFANCTGVNWGYPYELLSVTFSLTDVAGATWPATVDLVVYDRAALGHECHGPGLELCRYQVVCDRASFESPNFGTFTLPTTCCLKGPFFVGIEYTSSDNPALTLDQFPGDAPCRSWQFTAATSAWNESSLYWGSSPRPGSLKISVEVLPKSTNCTAACFRVGDPDNNGIYSISDCVYMINWWFAGGPGNYTLDLNADCRLDQADWNQFQLICPGGIIIFPAPFPPFDTVCTCQRPYDDDCDCVIGDANDDTVRNISDVVFIINAIFAAGEYPARVCGGDADGNCIVSISDAVFLINFIFRGGPVPLQCELWEFGCGTAN